MVIGLLGFTPLFSAVAMFRLSRRMIRNAEPHLEQASAVNVMMFTIRELCNAIFVQS